MAEAQAVSSLEITQPSCPKGRISLGICCMASKASSSPMQAILRRLELSGDFDISVFPEETILNSPIEEWPVVDCLIAFASSGFPLEKCIRYTKLVNPTLINNVEAQTTFRSRVEVYRTLKEWCIPCPDHIIVDHPALAQEGIADEVLVENENFIMYRGKKISKPFVEKPEDGDRHDIWIYYPRSIGGGAKKLFRKVKDKSSEFDASQNKIRRDGIYIYEPFLPTQGTDIKVYTVGAGYHHAEARKAPTVDGKVQRSKDGKEIRYPVVLTQAEKAICAFIVKGFRQNICGFDILRTDGGSYVCDVNGWSFVKGNQKYYNDCSTLIRKKFLEDFGVKDVDTSTMMILGPQDEVVRDTFAELTPYDSMRESFVNKGHERLRCVLVVTRHGDRRPKEKMKFKSKHPGLCEFFDLANEGSSDDATEVKLKTPEEMQTLKAHIEVIAREMREELLRLQTTPEVATKEAKSPEIDTKEAKSLEAAKVPESDGDTAKDKKEKKEKKDKKDKKDGKEEDRTAELKRDLLNLELLIPVLDMKDRFSGLERKVQLKASKWKPQKEGADPNDRKVAQIQLVAKWGGELTVSGLSQAEDLGRQLRLHLYPNDPTGLLRLHSSFRHDFKIYSSQEGRCQITAAAFTKGFLDLEGDITPILVSLVTRDQYAQALLDEPIPKKLRDAVKSKIEKLLMSDADMSSPEVLSSSCPSDHTGLREAARRIGSPLKLLHKIRSLTVAYIDSISAAKDRAFEETKRHSSEESQDDEEEAHEDAVPLGDALQPVTQIPDAVKDQHKRQWLHLRRKEHRWRKLFNGFAQLKDELGEMNDDNVWYDASKIPDVWDNLYYDMLTHRSYIGEESCSLAENMVGLIHPLNEWVCLSEYGISCEEKLQIGVDVTWRLIGKMLNDLEFMIDDDVGRLDEAGQMINDCQLATSSSAASAPNSPSKEDEPPGSPVAKSNLWARRNSSCAVNIRIGEIDSADGAKPLGRLKTKPQADPSCHPASPTFSPLVRSPPQLPGLQSDGAEHTPSPTNAGECPRLKQAAGSLLTGENLTGEAPSSLAPSSLAPSPTSPASPRDADCPISPGMPESMGFGEGALTRQLSERRDKRGSKLARLTPELRSELKGALRDSSDWHPRLNEEVAKFTDIKNTRIVRSRIYVTSASTMHSLVNILRHGDHASANDSSIVKGLDEVIDLNYLTQIVFRCYEQDEDSLEEEEQDKATASATSSSFCNDLRSIAKARYRVEISMSPGRQVFDDGQLVQWPEGSQLREDNCKVTPLQIIAESVELAKVESFLTEVVKEYGAQHEEKDEDDDAASDGEG